MIRRPPRSTPLYSSAASDVYKRQYINISETARNLGVIVDSQLTLSAQVSAMCRSGYYQLRSSDLCHLTPARRLDYCNSLFYGITDGLMSRLQSVQNAAARLVSGARRCDHITPATGAALASGSASGGFQDGHPGLLGTVRHGSSIPGRRLSAGLRRSSSSAGFCQLMDMCHQTDLQQL